LYWSFKLRGLQTRRRLRKNYTSKSPGFFMIPLLVVGLLLMYFLQGINADQTKSSTSVSFSHFTETISEERWNPDYFQLLLAYGLPGMKADYPHNASLSFLLTRIFEGLTGFEYDSPGKVLARGIAGFSLENVNSQAERMELTCTDTAEESAKDYEEDMTLPNRGERNYPAKDSKNGEGGGKEKENKSFDEDDAVILIYHNHITETFYPTTGEQFITNLDYTVAELGRQLADLLQLEYGIPVKHNTEIFDIPRRTAYHKARPHIRQIIEDNPQICMVVDIHRDGVSRQTSTATYEGEEMGNLLMVVGDGHEEWKQNFEFALILQQHIDEINPGVSRGVRKQGFTYNQDLHERACLIEIGGYLNSLEEAERAVPILAEALANTYCQLGFE